MRYFPFLLFVLLACSDSKTKTEVYNDEVKIAYDECGMGEITLLFAHGWSIDKSYWESQMEYFCDNYKVIAVDLAGHGDSGKNRIDWSIESYADDLLSVIDQKNLENVILVGHSMSGDIMVEAAVKDPRIISLVGIDNLKDVGTTMSDEAMKEVDNFLHAMENDFEGMMRAFAEGSMFTDQTDSTSRNRVINDFITADKTVAMETLNELIAHGPRTNELLAELQQPLYLLNSDNSPTLTGGLDSLGVNYRIWEIEGTGHYPMIEKPEEFNRLLEEIIKTAELAKS